MICADPDCYSMITKQIDGAAVMIAWDDPA
jgi:hypothetical protein